MDIRFYAMLRPIVGGKMVSLDLPDGSTARDVLVTVGKRYPEIDRLIWDANGGLGDYIKVFVDGRDIRYLQNLTPSSPRTPRSMSSRRPRGAEPVARATRRTGRNRPFVCVIVAAVTRPAIRPFRSLTTPLFQPRRR